MIHLPYPLLSFFGACHFQTGIRVAAPEEGWVSELAAATAALAKKEEEGKKKGGGMLFGVCRL